MRKLAILSAIGMAGMIGFGAGAHASCDFTVTAPASIQDAVDAAVAFDKVCLSGEFHQSVTIGTTASDITLTSVEDETAILDGSGTADAGTTLNSQFGIELEDGVAGVKIEDLEIRNYPGDRGSAIVAWDVSTTNIKIVGNDMHDNEWNGVLVGSEGGFIHRGWKVEDNEANDNGFVGIELTNCIGCSVEDNDLDGNGFAGVVVQARNTRPDSGPVRIGDVSIEENTITDTMGGFGIYVLSFTGIVQDPFDPITSASTLLTEVDVEENTITDISSGGTGIRFWAFNSPATADDSEIEENTIDCIAGAGGNSIQVLEDGVGGVGTVMDVEVEDNDIGPDCLAPEFDMGTTS